VAQLRRHQFKLAGGHPALDFINTVHDWTAAQPRDYLIEYADAIGFGETTGLLTRADVSRLRCRTARVELKRLRELRGRLRRILQVRLAGGTPSGTDLGRLAADLLESTRATRFMATPDRRSSQLPLRREVNAGLAGDALLRLRIVEAGVALLVSDAMPRIKFCPACGWFFLDLSKNRSRRWCSMDTCGAVAKSRRYYQKLKALSNR
jgi:predicted RNA-binding Zn ribbon-like protein